MNPSEQPRVDAVDARGQGTDDQQPSGNDASVGSIRGAVKQFCRDHKFFAGLIAASAVIIPTAQIGTCLNERDTAAIVEGEDEAIDRGGNWSTGTPDDCSRGDMTDKKQAADCDNPHLIRSAQ